MKWLPALLLSSVLCLAWFGGNGLPALQNSTTGGVDPTRVTTDSVNLRDGPSVSFGVVTVLEPGQDVVVTGPAAGGFLPVSAGGQTGWVASEYLADPASAFAWEGPTSVKAADSPQATEPPDPPPTVAVVADVPQPTVAPAAPPAVADAERWIRIDRSEATVSLMAGETTLQVFQGRIGRDTSADGFYATALGTFRVYSMNKGLAPTPFAEDTWLTDWVGFDPVRKNGIHSPVREANGTVRAWQNETTLGCVRLDEAAAVTVFEFAKIGMRVEVVE